MNAVHNFTEQGIGLKVFTVERAAIDAATAAGKLMFGIFAALTKFERELISERTVAGLASARTRGPGGGRPNKMTSGQAPACHCSQGTQ